MRVGLSAGLDPKRKKESDRTGHGLQKTELPALAAQELEAKKTNNLPKATPTARRRSPSECQTHSE